jgi:hypothetical protein
MGLYPVLPGEPVYVIGSPIFDKVTINLENGKNFVVRAINVSEKNKYIQSATLDGKSYTKSWFDHQEIVNGGEFVFEMGESPNYDWGTSRDDRPTTKEFVLAVAMPYYNIKENYFFDKATISLGSETENAKIYYTTDGSEPNEISTLYTKPFQINKTTEIKFYAQKEGLLTSTVVTVKIEKLEKVDVAEFKNYKGGNFKPGLRYNYYEEDVLYVDELDKFKPKKAGVTPNFSIAERENDGLFGFIYSGYIKIPKDGVYTFYLSSNDGGVLYMDGERFIDKDGPGTATPLSRMIALKKGIYRIGEKYFQMGGGYSNTVSWKGPGIKKEVIPASVLFHK